MNIKSNKLNGFTLIEMALVIVIISSVIIMMSRYLVTRTAETKRDIAVAQNEQILSAAMAYYINNTAWPANIAALKTSPGYLPNKTIKNPWAGDYKFYYNASSGVFFLCSPISGSTASNTANIIANRLPIGYVAPGDSCPDPEGANAPPEPGTCGASGCLVISSVNIPGQNLNNARSVNFAGVYHNGACVPVPVCPVNMTPKIYLAIASAGGNFGGGTEVYPISAFTAFARGPVYMSNGGWNMLNCTSDNPADSEPCLASGESNNGPYVPAGNYWRACIDLITEKGRVGYSTKTKLTGSVIAITRCEPDTENKGSDFTVFIKW